MKTQICTTEKYTIQKTEGNINNDNLLNERNNFNGEIIVGGNKGKNITPVDYIKELYPINIRNNMFIKNNIFRNNMFITNRISKNSLKQNKFSQKDSFDFLPSVKLMKNADLPVQSKIQILKVFSPKKNKTKLIKIKNSQKKESIFSNDNFSMRDVCIQSENNMIINKNLKRQEYQNANNNNNINNFYSDLISNVNLEKKQLNHEETMKQLFSEKYVYSRYIERGGNSKNITNNYSTLENLDYSLNYMLLNNKLKNTVDQKKPKHISSSSVFNTTRNVYSDKKNIINYNNLNIIQLNVFPNTNEKINTQENIRNLKMEEIENKEKNELQKNEERIVNTNEIKNQIIKNVLLKEERNKTFPNEKHMNRNNMNNSTITTTTTTTTSNNNNNNNNNNCGKKKKNLNSQPLSLKDKVRKQQKKEKMKETEKETETETDTETEVNTDTERETCTGWELDEYKINQMNEYSTNFPLDKLTRENHMSNRSLRKGKKKNMGGACLFNFNYFTCQFLLSCNKP